MLVENIDKTAKDIVFIYTTCPTLEEARSIGLAVIEDKLAISADYWVIGSIYPWHNVIQDVGQYMLMLTTENSLSERLMKHISGMHSYSAPMIVKLSTSLVNPNYLFWVDNTLNGKGDYISEHDEKMKENNDEEDGYHYGKLK
jgi:periplasmic divalent cation tolerance protein